MYGVWNTHYKPSKPCARSKASQSIAVQNLAIAFEHHNEQHPHSALKYRSPREFRQHYELSTQRYYQRLAVQAAQPVLL
jgi:hypothetical protein